jgi:3-methyladenine DNA glycosylase AlkD
VTRLDVGAVVARIRAELAGAGSDVGSTRAVRRRWTKELRAARASELVAVARTLVGTGGGWRERLVAFELLAGRADALARLDDRLFERFATGLGDWGSVDLFGCELAGIAWREGSLSDAKVRAWSASDDRWRRRLALVCTVPLNAKSRGGRGDAKRTLALARSSIDDRDDMVVKALSWALRELAKRDPAAVRAFLAEHGERLAARVRREVTAKLTTGVKNPTAAQRAAARSSR